MVEAINSVRLSLAPVAQWRERRFPKPQVVGSIPTGGANAHAAACVTCLTAP